MCEVWFSSCSGSQSIPLRLQQSEFRGGQSPHHLSPIFHRHPRHLGEGIFVGIYARLVRSTRLVKINKMQQNVAKSGWVLTEVARIGRSRSVYGQKRVEGGVGQSREPKFSVCCLHTSAHPFLARNRPGAPVFGHCPFLYLAVIHRWPAAMSAICIEHVICDRITLLSFALYYLFCPMLRPDMYAQICGNTAVCPSCCLVYLAKRSVQKYTR